MTGEPRAAVLYGCGLNCDRETAYAFTLAGARAERVHANALLAHPERLLQYDIFTIPGGFSHGDSLGAGKVLAIDLRHRLGEALQEFIDDGRPVLGICNGFQVLVKAGMIPDLRGSREQEVALTYNAQGRFEDRGVRLEAGPVDSLFLPGIQYLDLPVRHGEGNFQAPPEILGLLEREQMVALRYVGPHGEHDPSYPANPNGSARAIAGITNARGNVFGMMPHPEGFWSRQQHPRWTREEGPEEGDGLLIFRNAVEYARG
ncbi:MAG: phosphoribosylformylglycinamidine synthase subunit PurQ [Candidatus Aenigmarchaeota archaeon]|nr:phosphoribosylformylglycinamidine synthase subunit PurQ [Candidatus Aenigmarchaeota archaeon]